MRRNQIILLLALLGALLLVGGWWLLRDRGHAPAEASGSEPGRDPADPTSNPGERSDAPPRERPSRIAQPSPRERKAEFDRAKRDALRAEILQALAERPATAGRREPIDDDEPRPGTLQDRIGGREALAEVLNHDFMPLADECIEQARARLPELEGMVAIGLDTVADEELGGIVESVAMQPNNEVDDPELIECLSQTALSMILPPPPESGREQFVITMPIEPGPD